MEDINSLGMGMDSFEDDALFDELFEDTTQDTPPADEGSNDTEASTGDSGENADAKTGQDGTPNIITNEEDLPDGLSGNNVGDGNNNDSSQEGDGSSSDGLSSLHSSFASVLAEKGVISALDKDAKIESVEDIKSLVEKEIERREYEGLNDRQKEFLEALGNGVPLERFVQAAQTQETYNKVTDELLSEDSELRKTIITKNFMAKGISQAKAEQYAQRSIDLKEDEADAKEALAELKASEKANFEKELEAQKQAKAELEKKREENLNALKEAAYDEKATIVPGVKYSKQLADKVYKSLTEPAGYTEDGRPYTALTKARMDNPVEFDHKLHYLFQLTDGFKDFSSLTSGVKNEVTSEFDRVLKSNSNEFTKGTTRGGGTQGDQSSDIPDWLFD